MSNFNQEAYDRALGRRDLARTDLDELAQQVDDGEIDDSTAAGLRTGYEAELATAEAALASLGKPPSPKKSKPAPAASSPSKKRAPSEQGHEPKTGFNTRWLVGAGILVAALVVIIISVQNSSEPEAAAGGVMPGTGSDAGDPCAELADALTDHADSGFRLALADCYSQTGNAMSAIEHYRFVAESAAATPQEAGRSNAGLGVLNYQIGEYDSAVGYMNTALDLDPANVEAKFYLGMMLIYNLGDPAGGAPYLEAVLDAQNLPASVIQEIETALTFAQEDGSGS